MLIVTFRSRLTTTDPEGYAAMDATLSELVKDAPGFIAVKSYRADDGERLTLVWWQDAETLRAWRELPVHREAQRTGRAKWYEWYEMEVAEVVRESRFKRA